MSVFAHLLSRQFAHPVVAGEEDINGPAAMVLRKLLHGGGGRGGGGQVIDIDDDSDIGAREDELQRISGDDDGIYGDDDIAGADHLGRHLKDLDGEIARTESEARSASGKRKTRLLRHLSNLKAQRARKGGKFQHRLDRAVRKGRMTPEQAQAAARSAGTSSGGVASEAVGYPNQWQNAPMFTGQSIPESFTNRVEREPGAGENPRIPMLIADPVTGVFGTTALFAVPASLVAVSFPIVAQSAPIAYAGFQVIGIDVLVSVARGENASGFPNQDVLPSFLVSNYNVNGDKNLLYGTQSLKFAGQSTGLGGDDRRTISALRENPVLQPTNYVQAVGTFRQNIPTTNGYNVTVELAAVVRSIYDPAAGILPPGSRRG